MVPPMAMASGSRVSESLSELFPVLDVERVPGELLLLGGTAICHGAAAATGAAAEVPKVHLFNPVNSNSLVTITRVGVRTNMNSPFRATVQQGVAGANVPNARFRDSRRLFPLVPTAQLRTESDISLTTQQVAVQGANNVTLFLDDPNEVAVLAPGSRYEVGATVVISTITVTFWWRERPAEASELLP